MAKKSAARRNKWGGFAIFRDRAPNGARPHDGGCMIDAYLTATAIDYVQLAEIAQALERHIRVVSPRDVARSSDPPPVRLHFTANRLPEPIVVDTKWGVGISLWDIDGVCRYAGIDQSDYLLICALVGVSHWRVLQSNPILKPEDLRHPDGVHCVYTDARQASDFALLLESPTVCQGCVDFYHCLGADAELIAMREVLGEIAPRAPAYEEVEEPQEFERDH